MILVLALLLGCANAVDMPVRQSFAVEMVGREDIGNAVALNSAMFNGARVVGPAHRRSGDRRCSASAAAFAINAVSFLAVIVGLLADARRSELRTPAPHRPAASRSARSFAHLREGLDYVRSTPLVLLAVLVVGLVATVGMNFSVLIPALAQETLHSDAAGYGFLMAASGVGSLLAALLARVRRHARGRSGSPAGALILGVGVGRSSPSRTSFPCRSLLMVVVGFGAILMAATGNTTHPAGRPRPAARPGHERLHDGLRGSIPIGGLLMGGIASASGIGDRDRRSAGCCRSRSGSGRSSGSAGAHSIGHCAMRRQPPSTRTCRARSPRPPDRVRHRRPYVVGRAEDERGVQAAEPERGRQHAPVGAVAALAQQARQERRRVRDRARRG